MGNIETYTMKKVFIIHGWTYTLSAWDECVKELRARHIEPIQLRVPGLTEESSAVWDLEKYVAWLHEKRMLYLSVTQMVDELLLPITQNTQKQFQNSFLLMLPVLCIMNFHFV